MRAEDRVRLHHMIDAAVHAMQFVADRERSDLEADRMLLFAVVRGGRNTVHRQAAPPVSRSILSTRTRRRFPSL